MKKNQFLNAIALLTFSTFTWAQVFPSKPLKLVVPYAAGGVGDVTARLVAQKMSDDLAQPV